VNNPINQVQVFALDNATSWSDLEDAMTGCVNYQLSKLGKILPLMFFAPMTEPDNPDAWLPMKSVPENLFIVSIERKVDITILKALTQTDVAINAIRAAGNDRILQINFNLPLEDVYRQMTVAEAFTHAHINPGRDDMSFFFVRGLATVRAFDKELRSVTRG
jgi:hypothetical protein